MPFRIGATELIIILVIVLVIFGVGRLPEIGGALGKSIKNFKKGVTDKDEVVNTTSKTETKSESKANS
ncbi:MAG: twin-arginine translocase TatA/TatE family subunit [SAR202 cluster bacterium]|nr:twin-arginine translocase TatA/TatE family subunit [SAR202 cluster bacterium]